MAWRWVTSDDAGVDTRRGRDASFVPPVNRPTRHCAGASFHSPPAVPSLNSLLRAGPQAKPKNSKSKIFFPVNDRGYSKPSNPKPPPRSVSQSSIETPRSGTWPPSPRSTTGATANRFTPALRLPPSALRTPHSAFRTRRSRIRPRSPSGATAHHHASALRIPRSKIENPKSKIPSPAFA